MSDSVVTNPAPNGPEVEPVVTDPAGPKVEPEVEKLGEGGLAALQAERDTVKALKAEKAKADKRIADLEAERMTDEEKREKELETLRADAAESKRLAAEATAERLRASVALDKGLPANLASRLVGSTQEELEADADELLKLVPAEPTSRRPAPVSTLGSNTSGPLSAQDKMAEAFDRAFSR